MRMIVDLSILAEKIRENPSEWENVVIAGRRIVDTIVKGTPIDDIIESIDLEIEKTDSNDDYSVGLRNGMRYVKSLIDGNELVFELKKGEKNG